MFSLCLIALSLSIDALGAGFAYGIKKVSLPISSKLLISLMSTFCAYISLAAGHFLYIILPKETGSIISILILSLLGIYMILSAVRDMLKSKNKKAKEYSLVLDFIGITITIVKHPSLGDMDNSKSIDSKEALYIGLALSLDSIGAGIGYNIGAPSFFFPVFVGLFQLSLVSLGEILGKKLNTNSTLNETLISFIPGTIMLCLALWRVIELL